MKEPKELKAQQEAQNQEIYNTYARLFNTPDGQTVLGHLNSKYFMNVVGPNADHSYFMAQKDLMAFILETIQRGK